MDCDTERQLEETRHDASTSSAFARQLAGICFVVSLLISLTQLGHTSLLGPLDFGPKYAGGLAARQHADPYDNKVILRIEQSQEGYTVGYPYLDPPPFTLIMVVFAHISFHSAALFWFLIIVACVIGSGILVLLLLNEKLNNPLLLLFVAAATLDFAPARNGLGLGQSDPLVAVLSLGGVLLAIRQRSFMGGILQSLALMKPQVSLLALIALGASVRARIFLGVAAGLVVVTIAVELIRSSGLSLGTYTRWATRAAGTSHVQLTTLHVAEGALAIVALVLIVHRIVKNGRARTGESLVLLYSLGILLNAIVAPLVYLNLQSDILLMLPVAILVKRELGSALQARSKDLDWIPSIVSGVLAGCLLGDSLLAITFYSGRSHALLPAAITAFLLMGISFLYVPLRRAAAVAMGVTLFLTLLPFSPSFFDGLAVAVSFILLLLFLYTPRAIATGTDTQLL